LSKTLRKILIYILVLCFVFVLPFLPLQKTRAVKASLYILIKARLKDRPLAHANAQILCKTNNGDFVDSGHYTDDTCQVSYSRNNSYQFKLVKNYYKTYISPAFSISQSDYNALPDGITSNSKIYQYPTIIELEIDTINPPPGPPDPPKGDPVGHIQAGHISEPITDPMAPRNVSITVDTYQNNIGKVALKWDIPSAGAVSNPDNSVLRKNFTRYEIYRLDNAIPENYMNDNLYTGGGGVVNDLNATTFAQNVIAGRPDSKYCYYIKGVYEDTGAVSDRPCIDISDITKPKAWVQSSYSGEWPSPDGDTEESSCGKFPVSIGLKTVSWMFCELGLVLHAAAVYFLKKSLGWLTAIIGINVNMKFTQPQIKKDTTTGGTSD